MALQRTSLYKRNMQKKIWAVIIVVMIAVAIGWVAFGKLYYVRDDSGGQLLWKSDARRTIQTKSLQIRMKGVFPMSTTTEKPSLAMKTPPIVSREEWNAARQKMLVKEKAFTYSRDALAAERRRMPWILVEKKYEFEGPKGKVSLLDLFEGRRQLIVYRAFFEPGVFGWPDHACRGCSMGADQVSNLIHLNGRDTTLAYASRGPQADIVRLKARMGWEQISW